jgi:hypothetical protein
MLPFLLTPTLSLVSMCHPPPDPYQIIYHQQHDTHQNMQMLDSCNIPILTNQTPNTHCLTESLSLLEQLHQQIPILHSCQHPCIDLSYLQRTNPEMPSSFHTLYCRVVACHRNHSFQDASQNCSAYPVL